MGKNITKQALVVCVCVCVKEIEVEIENEFLKASSILVQIELVGGTLILLEMGDSMITVHEVPLSLL